MVGFNRWYCAIAVVVCFLVGCSDAADSIGESPSPDKALSGCADTSTCASNPPLVLGEDRPAQVMIPSNYTPSTRYPLVIVLHGYSANGIVQAVYLGLDSRVDSRQYVLVSPNGTANANGDRFWNAAPACCAKRASVEDGSGGDYSQIDDVAYIRGLIEEAAATYSIDTGRIGLIGHSNGGYMTLRMVCEASEYITSAVSIAGSTFENASSCSPATHPVSVLALHGDMDDSVLYEGGLKFGEPYPGAQETIERFASLSGCDSGNPTVTGQLDIVESIPGPETNALAFPDCAENTRVELWTMVGGPHIPVPWVESALDSFVDWLIFQPAN